MKQTEQGDAVMGSLQMGRDMHSQAGRLDSWTDLDTLRDRQTDRHAGRQANQSRTQLSAST